MFVVDVGGVACAADWGRSQWVVVWQCENSARLAWHRWLVGVAHRTQHMVSFCSGDYQRAPCKAPTGCACAKAPISQWRCCCGCPARHPSMGVVQQHDPQLGAIARRRPLVARVCPRCVAFSVSALWHVRRCGDAARQTLWRCAVSALPRSRVPALSVCVACAACWPWGGSVFAVSRSGRSGTVWVLWA